MWQAAIERAKQYLKESNIDQSKDLCMLYKAPRFFGAIGERDYAHQILDRLKNKFMTAEGDFVTSPGMKSESPLMAEFWLYPNGWICEGAHQLGRFDISYPSYRYIQRFFDPHTGGCRLRPGKDAPLEFNVSAQFGLVSLYMGELDKATRAGDFILSAIKHQPDLSHGLYLRLNPDGTYITDYPEEAAFLHLISAHDENQAYFTLGYMMAFLGKLHLATGDHTYLRGAHRLIDFTLNCGGNPTSFPLSHKLTWGSAVIYAITHDKRARQLSETVGDYLCNIQDESGCWHAGEPPITVLDQTAEIALWLHEARAELSDATMIVA